MRRLALVAVAVLAAWLVWPYASDGARFALVALLGGAVCLAGGDREAAARRRRRPAELEPRLLAAALARRRVRVRRVDDRTVPKRAKSASCELPRV